MRVLSGARLFTGERIVEGQAVLIDGARIAAVVPAKDAPPGERLPPDALLVPGFLDLQVNGSGGVLFNDTPTQEAALAIATVARRTGTTGVMPTLMTDEKPKMQRACEARAPSSAPSARGCTRRTGCGGPTRATSSCWSRSPAGAWATAGG
jgi:N-acetylglucosamine-6-phosphate deacetylase